MVRPEVIRKRLNKLDEYLDFLRGMRKYSLAEFIADAEHYGSAERFLQLAIEAIIDLGNHVIADLRLGVVDSYSDIPTILADSGYIDADLKDKWLTVIGFRNVLVHDYAEIDRGIVYQILQHRLGDLEQLRRVFAQFL
jgi:uncharacterized protein YutE (UPF0331/DUF86 family)